MTGGQSSLMLDATGPVGTLESGTTIRALVRPAVPLVVLSASRSELDSHAVLLEVIAKASGGRCVWKALASAPAPAGASQEACGA
jgi:DNA polymerase-3 subunit epsilon